MQLLNPSGVYLWVNYTPYSREILVTIGPEFDFLENSESVFRQSWSIDKRSNAMGIRLNGEKVILKSYDIVSSPVCDGTIQFTNDGPIVLLRQRQSCGGYPRCLVVYHESLNHLAQLSSGEQITFRLVTHQEMVKK